MTQLTPNQERIMKRGETYPTGGRFVGKAKRGSIWICYGDDREFAEMAAAFDRMYGR